MNAVVVESMLTCPHCGCAARETMPTDARLFFCECRGCGALLRPKGEMAKAAIAKTAAFKLMPTLTIAKLKAMPPAGSQAYLDLLETHYYAGLRKSGFPEQ